MSPPYSTRFGLRENPFRYVDIRDEEQWSEEDPTLPLVKTTMLNEVIGKAYSKTSTIFTGERGIGKSTTLRMACVELKAKGFNVRSVISPSTFLAFYQDIMSQIRNPGEEYDDVITDLFSNNFIGDPPHIPKTADGTPSLHYPLVCYHPQCPHLPKCALTDNSKIVKIKDLLGINGRLPKAISCPLYRWLTVRIAAVEGKFDRIFLLDAPDDMVEWIRYFEEFIQEFRKGNTIILMTTTEQYNKLRRTEYFSRWQHLMLDVLSPSELKEILAKRLESVRMEGEYPPLFSEEAVNYMVESSKGNPRQMIMFANRVAEKVVVSGRGETVDLGYLLEVMEGQMPSALDLTDAVTSKVRDLRTKKAGIVRNVDFASMLEKEYNIREVAPVTLGKLIANIRPKLRRVNRNGAAYDYGN